MLKKKIKITNSYNLVANNLKICDKSFTQIYNIHFQPLCNFAKKIVDDKEIAKDIVHDFFVVFWENRHTIQINTSLKAYLYSSIRNLCLKYLVHVKVMRKHDEQIKNMPYSLLQINYNNPLSKLITKETERELKNVIDRLPNFCREIFNLWEEGLSYMGISEKLKISIGTVKAQINRARTKCRKHLKSLDK